MILRRFLILISVSLLLDACHSSNEGGMPLTMLESDAGEAAIRHVITTLPNLNPGVAKNYSIVLGEISRDGMMTPASDSFVKRFANLNLEFVNAMHLKAHEPEQIIVDNKKFLATFVLQLRTLRQLSMTTWEAETGWSYKKDFGREKILLEHKEGRINVIKNEKIP
jgi:hypothetical protein